MNFEIDEKLHEDFALVEKLHEDKVEQVQYSSPSPVDGQESKKDNSKLIIFMILLVLIIAGFIIYNYLQKKNS